VVDALRAMTPAGQAAMGSLAAWMIAQRHPGRDRVPCCHCPLGRARCGTVSLTLVVEILYVMADSMAQP
jgi:hypothetical protein